MIQRYQPMIPRNAEVVEHRPIYKRIDISRSRLSRPLAISHRDVLFGADLPDPQFYEFNSDAYEWRLKAKYR